MRECKVCGSFAINENSHGRVPGLNKDLCDVCYWRFIAHSLKIELKKALRGNDDTVSR